MRNALGSTPANTIDRRENCASTDITSFFLRQAYQELSGSQHRLLSSSISYMMMLLTVFLLAFVQAAAAGEFRNEFAVR